jgi:hypothetical protein
MRVTTASELDWMQLFDALGPDGEGCFSFLLHLAKGRPSFIMRSSDMVQQISSCSIERFHGLCLRLVRFGLLRIRQKKNGYAAWQILRRPENWQPTDMSDGRLFHIPKENHFIRKRLT